MTTIISPSGQKNNEFATWDLAKKYRAGDLVVYLSKIYEANDNVPENTPFAIGTTGATWALAVDYVSSGTTPGGANTQVQFNNNGVFGADSTFTFVASTGTVTIQNLVVSNTALTGFTETVTTPAFNATFAPNVALSSIVKFTATSNFTFNGFTTPVAGQSATVIVTQDGTGSRLMTSTMKFSGGINTLSTAAGAIDIISVFYDGSVYYASLTTAYA